MTQREHQEVEEMRWFHFGGRGNRRVLGAEMNIYLVSMFGRPRKTFGEAVVSRP